MAPRESLGSDGVMRWKEGTGVGLPDDGRKKYDIIVEQAPDAESSSARNARWARVYRARAAAAERDGRTDLAQMFEARADHLECLA